MGDRLRAGKPSRYVTSHLGQLSLNRVPLYRPVWRGVFTCVRWQVTLCDCDPIWRDTS